MIWVKETMVCVPCPFLFLPFDHSSDDAEYTGAQERIALSKKGRKNAEKERKKGMVELIEEA